MKVVNVILSVLILLLAIASAVFSYFLFEKRGEMIEGWRKLASTINQSATEMDKGSGTKVGEELTTETLSHEKYAELDQRLAKLTAQSRDLTKQRDELVASLRNIASIVEMKDVPSNQSLSDMTTYSTAKDDVVNGAGDLVGKRNKIVERMVNAARDSLKLSLDSKKLQAADQATLNDFTNRLKQYGNERREFEAALNTLYKQGGGQGNLDFSGNYFAGSLTKIKAVVSTLKSQLDEANRTIANRNQEIQRQKNQLGTVNNQLASTKKTLDDKSFQLESLRDVLGLADDVPIPMPWKAGSVEARKMAVGRVADVSSKYGYIAIDLGTDSTVPQPLGERVGNINIEMAPGLEMVVSRGDLDIPTSEFITKIKITKVDKTCSIAEPFGDQNGKVKVGDKVWFELN
ncbi:MAG: hypothetical protein LBM70_04175 [Victivallales bacterium]|jgi:CII-binding regulator of phage lambda lysogenization HflD|nr:hypothetical protein [Victivallales bacterium]